MAGEGDAKARFPRQDVGDGQEHGYLGDVEVYDQPAAGSSNATAAERAASRPSGKGAAKTPTGGTVGAVTEADVQGDGEG